MPTPTLVGPRAPKEDFMKALNLSPQNTSHEGYYRAMRDEAILVYNSLNENRDNLVEEKRRDKNYQPPFFWHHIIPDRRRTAIIDVWQNARAGSTQRQLFDRGATNGEYAPNWVTLWLLYSVFRSRDIRNNRNRRNGDSGGSASGPNRGGGNSDSRVYDPARNIYRSR